MARPLSSVIAALVLFAACGDSGTTTSTSTPTTTTTVVALAATPQDAVETWLQAITDGEGRATTAVVDDVQLALILAVDNPLDIAQIADLVRGGVTDDLRVAYWASFGVNFTEFAGRGTERLAVKKVEEFTVGPRAFASVEIGFTDRIGSTSVVTAREGEGWIVDLMATLGPTLVRPLRDLLVTLGPDEDGAAIRDAMVASIPSLRAALTRPGVLDLPVDFVLETESLVEVLSPPVD